MIFKGEMMYMYKMRFCKIIAYIYVYIYIHTQFAVDTDMRNSV